MRREALNWLAEAEVDLGRAERAFNNNDYALAAFMSQQACEKAFKAAYLALARSIYPRTHDLTNLYDGIRGFLSLGERIESMLAEVSQYYTIARYPNAGLERPSRSITRMQAERALEVAREVVRVAREKIGGAGSSRED
ncbi:MAG: HEPN domain-containing protein [Desulfurococcales archaeon]|nr:HEPN domain-containing protein [Desulfurococcales archaeon]